MRKKQDFAATEPDAVVRRLDRLRHQPPPLADDGPEAWTLSVNRIFDDSEFRLDAKYHDPSGASEIIRHMKDANLDLKPLGDLAKVRLPGQFERVWARDAEHGSRYLNATDLLSLFARGRPSGEQRYLSRASQVDFDALIIRQNMLLVTCSGTIGRVYHVPQRLDGWAATHDLIRIVPDDDLSGYLYAWCLSPEAQVQMLNPTHGAQIDHITDDQLSKIQVPMLPSSQMQEINAEVLRALEIRERALATIDQAVDCIA